MTKIRTAAGREDGAALVIAVMAVSLMLALGGAVVLLAVSETAIAANFRVSQESWYAADAGLERALADLRGIPDWTPVLGGAIHSGFVDGPPSGTRTLVDGSRIDLTQVANLANCQHAAPCSTAEITTVTTDRPWGANNPHWTPFAFGPLARLAPSTFHSPFFVVTMVGDDPSENDGDPMRDGGSAGGTPNPGLGVIVVRAEAFGPRAAHRVVEATVARTVVPPVNAGGEPSTDLRVLSSREVH